MKEKNTENEYTLLAGIPVEPDLDEPWRKQRPSCSGSGRIEKNFDFKGLKFLEKLYRE